MDNYLGMPGLTGAQMLSEFEEHAHRMGVEFVTGRAISAMALGDQVFLTVGSEVYEGKRLILATGGGAMVKAAYSSGTPAIGVGAGNGPAYIHHTADVRLAVKRILDSKTFDNGTICASEQSIICDEDMVPAVRAEMEKQGAYFLNESEREKLGRYILRANGTMNPEIVGRSVETIARLAGLTDVPATARVLVAAEDGVGRGHPYSNEKMAPILAFTSDEIWLSMPHRSSDDARNVVFNDMNKPFTDYALDETAMEKWSAVEKLRDDVNAVLEAARAEKKIGKALEAHVALHAGDDAASAALVQVMGLNLAELFIVSDCQVSSAEPDAASTVGQGANFPGLTVEVSEARGDKCERCWMHSPTVGADADHPTLCARCAAVVRKLPQF